MAPVLQCPDCGQKHPLDAVSETPAFRCKGCGRMLKLPPQLLPSAPDAPQPLPSHFPPRRVPSAMRARGPVGNELPRIVRIAIWLVAVPLGFVLVFGITRALGFLTQRQLEDAFLLSGFSRFWPIVRLLPFWALVTALLVQLFVEGGRAFAARRRNAGPRDDGPPSAPPPSQDRPRRPAPARS